ncbi:MAG: tetratricopeptide repeat protein [Pedosphaera sp.]|nr:tetratricopeptide repeat protein [Pedosphaera sp.]
MWGTTLPLTVTATVSIAPFCPERCRAVWLRAGLTRRIPPTTTASKYGHHDCHPDRPRHSRLGHHCVLRRVSRSREFQYQDQVGRSEGRRREPAATHGRARWREGQRRGRTRHSCPQHRGGWRGCGCQSQRRHQGYAHTRSSAPKILASDSTAASEAFSVEHGRAGRDIIHKHVAQEIHYHLPQSHVSGLEVPTSHSEERPRRIDAAVPSRVKLGDTFDLLLQVKMPESPPLGLSDWPSKLTEPERVEQVSEVVPLSFPTSLVVDSLDEFGKPKHRLLPTKLRASVVAPEFDIQGSHEKLLEVPPEGNSKVISFLLTAKKRGNRRLNVEIYRTDGELVGTIPVATNVNGETTFHEASVASLVLVVIVGGESPTKTAETIRAPSSVHADEGRLLGAQSSPSVTDRAPRLPALRRKHVFLSYCRDNAGEAAELREALIAAGEEVWWDQDILPGQDFRFAIRQAMKASYAVVLCLSRETERRITTGIYPEALEAIGAYREYAPGANYLIPVRFSECEVPPIEIDATRTLDRLQYLDLFPPEVLKAQVQRLVRAIKATPFHPQRESGTKVPIEIKSHDSGLGAVVGGVPSLKQTVSPGAVVAKELSAGHDNIIIGTLIQQAASAVHASPLHQLPPPPAAFTGRDEELADLEKKLTTDHAAGATISGKQHAGLQGLGGVGKTALATVLAHRLQDRYPDAQLYLNLRGADPDHRPPVTSVEAMQTLIHVFRPEARLPDSLDQLTPWYHSVLNDAGRVLLLLDNAADADQVRPLLPPANCLLIVTSRAQFQLPGLATRNIDCLAPAKSQELLLKLSARFYGVAKEAAELCGHLPLALEVFAGAVNGRNLSSVRELLDRLRAGKDKLSAVDATFQLSYELLADDLRGYWVRLAVFSASFDLPAAAAVWSVGLDDVARDVLQVFVNASLVEYNQSNGRFRLHDLVRQFCDGKLNEAQRIAARLRHARHYCSVGATTDKLYQQGGENVRLGVELFDRERTHLEAAFDWLQTRRDQETAALLVELVDAVAYTGGLRFHPRQRIRWLEGQLAAARITKNRGAEGAALGNLGNAYAALGDARKAIEFHEQALVIAREIGDRRGEGAALGNLGHAYAALGDARKAIEFHEQALVIAREIGDRRGEGQDLGNLGSAYFALGDARKAIEFYEQQLVIGREIGDRRGEGTALGNLGIAYRNLGDTRKAIEFYEQALVVFREIGDRRGEGNALGNLGNAYAALGDARKAIEFYEQHRDIAREIGDRRGAGNALWNSALALDQLGDRAQAMVRAEEALRIREAIEDPNAAQVRAQLAKWRGQ